MTPVVLRGLILLEGSNFHLGWAAKEIQLYVGDVCQISLNAGGGHEIFLFLFRFLNDW